MQGTASFRGKHPVLICDDLRLNCFKLTGKRKRTKIKKRKSLYIIHGNIMSTTKYCTKPSHNFNKGNT